MDTISKQLTVGENAYITTLQVNQNAYITGSLQVGNYSAGIRPFVSVAVPAAGGTYWNRGQKTASCSRESTGVYLVSWSEAHPDGAQYVPQYCLLNGWGLIRSGERTSTTIRIQTATSSEAPFDLDFWFTLH